MTIRPSPTDFEANAATGGIEVIFRPTKTSFTFSRLPDYEVSAADPIIRHAYAGGLGDYAVPEVHELARRAAQKLAQGF
jgi:hypothetical protein